MLIGAQGINSSTRFLASVETAVSHDWKKRIVYASSEDAIKGEFINDVFPSPSKDIYQETFPRALRTSLIDRWNGRPRNEAEQQAEQLTNIPVGAMK